MQQCIANLQSELHHLYEHREVIAAEFVNKRLLQAQYPHNKSLRTRCSLWANWGRAELISALQAVYPQISRDTNKTYLDMITDLKFVYNIKTRWWNNILATKSQKLTNIKMSVPQTKIKKRRKFYSTSLMFLINST